MGKSSDELRQEIDMHRADAERKINDLQGQIQGTADDLKSQAQGTVEDLRHQVQDRDHDGRPDRDILGLDVSVPDVPAREPDPR